MTLHIIVLLFLHFIGDFILQTDKQAINKSKSSVWLTTHVSTYILVFAVFGLFGAPFIYGSHKDWMLYFLMINFILHWITDYFTSRINSKLYQANQRHWFFVGIGADQFIHACCLILTYQYLKD